MDALHVLSAVLLVGPLMVAPFVGRRAIQRRSADGVRIAARQITVYGFASLVTAALGVLTVLAGDQYGFRDPWIVISITLYLVALGLVFFYAAPALRKAAKMVEQGVLSSPISPVDDAIEVEAGPEPAASTGSPLTATAADLQTKERLDAITGRVGMAGLLVLLVFAAITIMMTTRPFQ